MAALDKQRVPVELLSTVDTAGSGDGLTASLLYLPAQLSGGRQTELRVGNAPARRLAVSFCPTGADVDLFVVEGALRLTGEHPRIAVGGTSARTRVGEAQLGELVARWTGALEVLASVSWVTCPANVALARLRDMDS